MAGLMGSAEAAENLLVNGDFNTGALTPWTGAGTITNNACVVTSGQSVTQTVATVVGTKYYVAATAGSGTFSSYTMTAQPTAGGPPDGTKVKGAGARVGSSRMGFVFEARTTSTNIVLAGTVIGGFAESIVYDDVVLFELPPSKFAGRYAGTASTVVAIDPPPLSNAINRRVVARITSDSRLFIMDGTAIHAGIVFNDGTFDLALNPPPAGFGANRVTGTATVKGRRLTLTFPGAGVFAVNELSDQVASTVTMKFVITRVGN